MHCKARIIRSLVLLLAAVVAPLEAADWQLLPDDVHAALHLDMKALAGSPLYRALLEGQPAPWAGSSSDYLALVEATGFDLRKDLDTLTVGAGGDPHDREAPFYVIVTGRFDHARIETWVRESGEVATGRFEDLRTYQPAVEVDSGPSPTAAFIDEQTLIVASAPDFSKLVAATRRKQRTAAGTSLAQLLTSAEGQLRLAVELPASDKRSAGEKSTQPPAAGWASVLAHLDGPAAGPLGHLQSIVLALDADSGLELAIRAAADSPASGKLVHDTLAGYLMLGRAISLQNPQLGGLLERVQLEQQGSTVRISASLSADEIASALARAAAPPPG